jgi:cytohesin
MKKLLATTIVSVLLATTAFADPIHDAAKDGYLTVVQAHLDAGANVNAKNEDGWTPLHFAAQYSHKEIVELLIANGADVKAMGESSPVFSWQGGFTPLHYAAVNGHEKIAELLIDNGAEVNVKNEDGWTPLHWAAHKDHGEIVGLLIAKGAEVNARTEQGQTPLDMVNGAIADFLLKHGGHSGSILVAVTVGDLAGVQALLDAGADVNAKDENDMTALHYAAEYGHEEIVELLLAKEADVNAKANDGKTPLDMANGATADRLRTHGGHSGSIHVSARDGDLAGVQALLDIGADVNAKDVEGWAPLHYSARNGHEEIVELLLAKGADVNVKDESEETAVGENVEAAAIICHDTGHHHGAPSIHVPARDGDLSGVQELLDDGADVNAKDEHGWTALHYAAFSGHREIIELLLAKGANVTGMTALHYAASGGHEEIVELLLAKGADVNAKAKDGKTPLDMANGATADLLRTHGSQSGLIHVAVRDGDLAGVQALLDAGADVNSGLGKYTLLHFAARHGHEEIVELLISEGADVNAKDENSWTPLHFAARHGHKEIVELLIAKGAEVNATNNFEDTPLDFADGEIADFLRIHGGFTGWDLVFMPLLVYSNDQLAIEGWIGLKYEVLYSSDLKEWQVMETITLETSPQVYVDKTATEQPMRFYHLRLVE